MTNSSSSPPGGRLSSIRCAQGNIHIQTEFATFPSDRIVTTVMLNGAVLFKDTVNWNKAFLTRDGYLEAEEALNSRHQKIYEETRQKIMLGGIGELVSKMEPEKSGTDITNLVEKIKALGDCLLLEVSDRYCGAIYVIDSPSLLVPHWNYLRNPTSELELFAEFLSNKFECGKFNKATYHSPANNYCWVAANERLFVIQSAQPEATLMKVSTILEEDERISP